MYLTDLFIRNNGPIEQIKIKFELSSDEVPIPHVLVGLNGSGKTNILSIIVDALFEGAADAYEDVISREGLARRWFRLIGSKTIRIGAEGGYAVLQFSDAGSKYLYCEKGGNYDAAVALNELEPILAAAAVWPLEGPFKSFKIPEKAAERIYAGGAYAYFPASRSEIPHWLNRGSLPEEKFDTSGGIASNLGKPLFIEKGLDALAQWLMSVIVDARIDPADVSRALSGASILTGQFSAGIARRQMDAAGAASHTWNAANDLLRIITQKPAARFVWLGRQHSQKISMMDGGKLIATGLDGLSGGQATLLNMFGTLLRYGDAGTGFMRSPNEMVGICVIDEIDAHMHVDLQIEVLPQLIRMFPKIQFIVSGHSPFFLLGMEREFGVSNFKVVDVPSGRYVDPEIYDEFGKAMEVIQTTRRFQDFIDQAMAKMSKPKVWFEGETDPIYFSTAAKLYGYDILLEQCELDWIGSKNKNGGQGFNTGKDALDKARSLILAKPGLIKEPVILVYDCDANKAENTSGNVHVIGIEINKNNTIACRGVENLLPHDVFTEDMYDDTVRQKDYGGSVTTKELNKMRLCKSICDRQRKNDFSEFVPTLQRIAAIISR